MQKGGGEDNVALYAAPNPFLCTLYLNKIWLNQVQKGKSGNPCYPINIPCIALIRKEATLLWLLIELLHYMYVNKLICELQQLPHGIRHFI